MDAAVSRLLDQAAAGRRLTPAEGLLLLERAELNELGRAALAMSRRLHPRPEATYVVDRNVSYTNICVTDCEFCAFHRRPDDPEAYVLSREDLYAKLRELTAIGGTQVLLQGGHHPHLKLEWYEELLRGIHREFPGLHVHGFSPAEIVHFARLGRMEVREVLRRLKAAGLDSLPGGGAEILVDRVRKLIAPRKARTDAWLEVFVQAHAAGLKGSCTMVIGHLETLAERIEHLERLRQVQDQTGGLEAGVWVAFIVWTLQPWHTRLEGKVQPAGAVEYLRMLAVARLYLDNIRNVQASWPTQGAKIGQLSFLYGSNDWGGLMMEENVLSGAGTVHQVEVEELRRLSAELGLVLRQRDFYYRRLD